MKITVCFRQLGCQSVVAPTITVDIVSDILALWNQYSTNFKGDTVQYVGSELLLLYVPLSTQDLSSMVVYLVREPHDVA